MAKLFTFKCILQGPVIQIPKELVNQSIVKEMKRTWLTLLGNDEGSCTSRIHHVTGSQPAVKDLEAGEAARCTYSRATLHQDPSPQTSPKPVR